MLAYPEKQGEDIRLQADRETEAGKVYTSFPDSHRSKPLFRSLQLPKPKFFPLQCAMSFDCLGW